MHLNKNHTFSRRALAMLLTLTLCLSLVPSAFAAQQNSYHDPAEHWMQASNRTNELDVNSVVTRETFKCGECGKVTSFEVFRVPEYTRNGQTALSRNVKYSDGTMMDGVGKGDCMDGVPGKDAYYTGYHYTKAVCETCGGINTNEPKSDYGYLKNVYWLFDCAAEFTQKLEETVTYEYTDDTYHTVTTKGGTYCAFCYGTNHTVNSTLERHSMETEVLPQPANGRFATVEKCSLCDYASYDYTAAKAVIADYYGVVDGQPHTITVSDLSEAGVRTSIRYGNSAESCTMTSAPNYTEEGQYTVYYEITYTYQNVSMTENGVANVWLRDTQASEDGKCTCGCDDPNCGCQDKNCGGNCCSDKGCGENHHFILLDRTKAGCITLGYDRYLCTECGKIEKRDYVDSLGHAWQSIVIRDATCETDGKLLELCSRCGQMKQTSTPKGEHQYKTYPVAATCTNPGYTVRECSVCGDRHIEDITSVLPHPAIIDKEAFQKVQALLQRKAERAKKRKNKSPFSMKIFCGYCGTPFHRRCTKTGYTCWTCRKHDRSAASCPVGRIPESEISAAFLRMYRKLKNNADIILKPAMEQLNTLDSILRQNNPKILTINRAIAEATEESHKISTLRVNGLLDADACTARMNVISARLAQLRGQRRRLAENEKLDEVMDELLKVQQAVLDGPDQLDTFDDDLFESLVEKIVAESQTMLRFRLYGGLELTERLEVTAR